MKDDRQLVNIFLIALDKISDITTSKMRTKAEMASAIDEIGMIASKALADRWCEGDANHD